MAAVCNVADYAKSTKLLASTTLRTILGTKSLSEILSDRETIAGDILALAFLAGIPIPKNNLGIIVEDLVEFESEEEKLAARFYNSHQLAKISPQHIEGL